MKGLLYRNGRWEESVTGLRNEIRNPATGELVGSVPAANEEDLRLAVNAAHEAFPGWSKKTAAERAELLYKAFEGLRRREAEIAETLTLEQGKPLPEALGEVRFAAEFLRWYSEEAKRVYGETIPASSTNKRIIVIRQPVGVVGAITPWNFPASMVTRKIAPALAAGCTVVLKPAESTPLTAVLLLKVFHEAGFPPGVVNLVTGEGSVVGSALVNNPKVNKITFTGSTEVGKLLLRDAAEQVKRVSLELGGHAPFLVFDDADLEQAAEACIVSKFRNAGQTCICANRIFVQDTVIDKFAQILVDKVRGMKIGNGMEQGVEIGPLIDRHALEKVDNQVRDALSKGAVLLTGGKEWGAQGLTGAFYEPTILSGVTDEMIICHEETFGPIAPLIAFSSEEEALRKANQVSYGLAAYAFTRGTGRTFRIAEGLEYGIVGMNDPLPSVAQAPFGGWKESGLGREGGHFGLEPFLEIKYISLGL